MIFGKAINRYYLKHAPVLLLGILSLLTVDYIQLLIPELYRLVINGVNLGQVVVDGQTLPFTREVLFQHICLPMIWIVVLMVIGRFFDLREIHGTLQVTVSAAPICGSGCLTTAAACPSSTIRSTRSAT